MTIEAITWIIPDLPLRARAESTPTPMMPQPDDDTAFAASPPAGLAGRPPSWRRLSGRRHEGARARRRRDRRHHRLRARRRRPRGDRGRPPAGAGAGDQLRQCRRGLAGLFGALGRARRAAEGDQVAGDAPPAAGDPAAHRPCLHRLGRWRCCATAPRRATRSTRRAWCGSPSTAATACAPCAPTPASPTTSGCRARCSCSGRRSSSTAAPTTSPCCAQSGVAFELLDRAGCIRHEPALAQVSEKFVGGLLLPGDETGDCFKFTQALAKLARRARRRRSASAPRIRGLVRSGKRIDGVATDAGTLGADAYLVALGSYSPLLLGRSACASRSIRSRATRSRCRSSTRPARPNRR